MRPTCRIEGRFSFSKHQHFLQMSCIFGSQSSIGSRVVVPAATPIPTNARFCPSYGCSSVKSSQMRTANAHTSVFSENSWYEIDSGADQAMGRIGFLVEPLSWICVIRVIPKSDTFTDMIRKSIKIFRRAISRCTKPRSCKRVRADETCHRMLYFCCIVKWSPDRRQSRTDPFSTHSVTIEVTSDEALHT